MNLQLLMQPQWRTLVPIQQQQQQQLKCKKWEYMPMPIRIKSSSSSNKLVSFVPSYPRWLRHLSPSTTTDTELQQEKNRRRNTVLKWADNQSLPVAAAVVTLYYAINGAASGLFVHLFLEAFIPYKHPTAAVQGQGHVAVFINSFLKGPLCVRNFAILIATNFGLNYVIKRLKGRHHACTLLVPGFCAGVMLSLVCGIRDPRSIILFGVFFSLYNASAKLVASVVARYV